MSVQSLVKLRRLSPSQAKIVPPNGNSTNSSIQKDLDLGYPNKDINMLGDIALHESETDDNGNNVIPENGNHINDYIESSVEKRVNAYASVAVVSALIFGFCTSALFTGDAYSFQNQNLQLPFLLLMLSSLGATGYATIVMTFQFYYGTRLLAEGEGCEIQIEISKNIKNNKTITNVVSNTEKVKQLDNQNINDIDITTKNTNIISVPAGVYAAEQFLLSTKAPRWLADNLFGIGTVLFVTSLIIFMVDKVENSSDKKAVLGVGLGFVGLTIVLLGYTVKTYFKWKHRLGKWKGEKKQR